MKKSRFTESQIVSILKESDAGMKVEEVCRRHGISSATYYNWKSKYGGMVDFPGFARHQIALKCNSMRGVYERQTVYR